MPYKDYEKQKAWQRQRSQNNRQRLNDRQKELRLIKKEKLIKLKDAPCSDCGNKYPHYVMDYHHRDKTDKFKEISKMIKRNSWDKILEEIKKCDLICSNCHRIREYNSL